MQECWPGVPGQLLCPRVAAGGGLVQEARGGPAAPGPGAVLSCGHPGHWEDIGVNNLLMCCHTVVLVILNIYCVLGWEEAPEHFFRRTAITSPDCQEFMV